MAIMAHCKKKKTTKWSPKLILNKNKRVIFLWRHFNNVRWREVQIFKNLLSLDYLPLYLLSFFLSFQALMAINVNMQNPEVITVTLKINYSQEMHKKIILLKFKGISLTVLIVGKWVSVWKKGATCAYCFHLAFKINHYNIYFRESENVVN